MIMRYQRISPDSLSLSKGRKTNPTSNSSWKTSKEDEERGEINGNVTTIKASSTTFETKGGLLSRFRSLSRTCSSSSSQEQHHHIGNGNAAEIPNSSQNLESNGDHFLQWGQRKRSRCSSRGIMTVTDDTSSSSSNLQFQSTKIQRRSSVPNSSPNANLMPPPSITSNGIIKSQSKSLSSTPFSPVRQNLEELSGAGGGNKSPPPPSRGILSRSRVGKKSTFLDKKNNHPSSSSNRDEKMNQEVVAPSDVLLLDNIVSPPQQGGGWSSSSPYDDDNNAASRLPKLGGGGGGGGGAMVNNGGGGEVHEWPRIYIPLSRKEKEEDFLAMKGTKLPHRPKKRPKAVEKTLQYCFPGMWLSDLTRGRYEVREKKEKCPRKAKRRGGLKGMESMESDSD